MKTKFTENINANFSNISYNEALDSLSFETEKGSTLTMEFDYRPNPLFGGVIYYDGPNGIGNGLVRMKEDETLEDFIKRLVAFAE